MSLLRICFAMLAIAAAQASAVAVAQERILLFVSDVKVERNGDLLVSETIRVQAEGKEIRRGILRDFPTTYTRSDGTRADVGFEVQSVTRDGRDENYTTERVLNGVRVRIGRADQFLNRGPHQYVIVYRTTRQIGFFPTFDELYWNATGNGWTFPIDVAEARITLPESVSFRQSAFYTGPQGARGQDAAVVEQRAGRIVFRTTRPLPPRNGLTVAASWEKGVVTPPTQSELAGWWLADNAPLVIAALGLVLLAAYYLFAWNRVGRDPQTGTIIPLFEPPHGLSAAAVRFVHRMGFDDRCFVASIIDLGVNGHLKLTESSDKTLVEKRAGGKPMPPAEDAEKNTLFGSQSSVLLDQVNHERLGKAKEALKKGLTEAYSGKLFHTNTGWSLWGLLAGLVLVAVIVVAVFVTYGNDAGVGTVIGLAFGIPGAMIGAVVLRAGWRGRVGLIWLLIGCAVAVVLIAIGLGIYAASVRDWGDVLPGLAAVASAALVALGFDWLQAPTREGRRVMDGIEGLRQYLGVAEEDRLQFLHPPEKTPQLFERFLPYAVALDVENAWAQRFAGVLAAAAAGAAAAAASTWYSGDRDWSRDPVGFAENLGSDLSQTITAASTAPGSSDSGGSSGGGSSGGGGGGGGGSGW